jgi:hypothetical protein
MLQFATNGEGLGKGGRRAKEEGVQASSATVIPATAGFLLPVTWRGRIHKVQRQQTEKENTGKHQTNGFD